MAKTIKVAGMIFFVLVVSCLLLVGGITTTKVTDYNSNNLINTNAENNISEAVSNDSSRAINDIAKTYTDVTGDSATIVSRWNEIREESYTLNKFIKIKLTSDWVINECLTISDYQRIIIDLNGHFITRNLTKPNNIGSVFNVITSATLTIEDSVFSSKADEVLQKAEQLASTLKPEQYITDMDSWESDSDKLWKDIAQETGIGYITGGYAGGNGGGIWVKNATLNVNGGMICNNYVTGSGGGIFVDGNQAFLNYNNGIVACNYAKSANAGAGIYSNALYTNIGGGLVVGNLGSKRGGAFYLGQNSQVSNCVVYKNSQESMGALYLNCQGRMIFNNVRIEGNATIDSGGGVYLTGNTNGTIVDMDNVSFIDKISTATEINGGGGGLQVCYASQASLNNCIFRGNRSNTGGAGIDFSSKGTHAISSKVAVRGFLDMSDNIGANGEEVDIMIKKDGKLRVETSLTLNPDNPNQEPVVLKFEDKSGLFHSFTSSYSTFTQTIDPNKYFTCGITSHKAVVNSFGELMFAKDENSVYDFEFLENGIRKNYDGNEKLHGYNDNDISTFVLGKIAPNTSINEFVENLASLDIDKNDMKLFNSRGMLVYENGNALAGYKLNDKYSCAVGTGWKIEYTKNSTLETIYLSILGDVTGDGNINAMDVAYLRSIANGEVDITTLAIEKQLASYIDNRGQLTSADAEILNAYIKYEVEIELYF